MKINCHGFEFEACRCSICGGLSSDPRSLAAHEDYHRRISAALIASAVARNMREPTTERHKYAITGKGLKKESIYHGHGGPGFRRK